MARLKRQLFTASSCGGGNDNGMLVLSLDEYITFVYLWVTDGGVLLLVSKKRGGTAASRSSLFFLCHAVSLLEHVCPYGCCVPARARVSHMACCVNATAGKVVVRACDSLPRHRRDARTTDTLSHNTDPHTQRQSKKSQKRKNYSKKTTEKHYE